MRVELADGGDEADAPFRDQVAELHAVAAVLKRDRNDVAQVRFDQLVSGGLVAIQHLERELVLIFARELGDGADLLDVSIEGDGGLHVSNPYAFRNVTLPSFARNRSLSRLCLDFYGTICTRAQGSIRRRGMPGGSCGGNH